MNQFQKTTRTNYLYFDVPFALFQRFFSEASNSIISDEINKEP